MRVIRFAAAALAGFAVPSPRAQRLATPGGTTGDRR